MMKGMREAVSCAKCIEVFQAGVRDPLVLPCGHTFCRSCLNTVKNQGSLSCPTCRQSHNVFVEKLSVNYSLLSLSSVCPEFESENCSEHGDDLRYWCCECELPLCSLCLYSGHPQGHNVKLINSYIQEKKRDIQAEIKMLEVDINGHREEVRSKFVKLVQDVNELCKRSSTLHNTQLDVDQFHRKVRKARSIDSIGQAEDRLKEFSKMLQMFVTNDEQSKNGTCDDDAKDSTEVTEDVTKENVKEEVTEDDLKEVADTETVQREDSSESELSQQSSSSESVLSQQSSNESGSSGESTTCDESRKDADNATTKKKVPDSVSEQSGAVVGISQDSSQPLGSEHDREDYVNSTKKKVTFKEMLQIASPVHASKESQPTISQALGGESYPRAVLDCRDGKLRLHCLSYSMDSRLSLKLPSEVFLELSVGDQCLGQVYIRLWCHLRRAHQFMALCLGTLGPSYHGTTASRVANRDTNGEHIIFETVMDTNKLASLRPVMTELEWGGSFSKTAKGGRLLAFESGRTSNCSNPGFSICTRDYQNSAMSIPFGEVTSGLDVVKAAIGHQPVTQVKISECGLVLPDFTL